MNIKRELRFIDVYCIATGAMISSGIFVLPGIAHAKAGPSVILSYFFAGLLATSGMFSAAEMATAMPKAGGDYFFITRALGPLAGTIAGLLNWSALSLKSSFALIGMAAFVQLYINIDLYIPGLIFCAFFVILNLAGAKHVGRLQIVIVACLLVLMLAYICLGLRHISLENFAPFASHGFKKTIATAGFVFVSYGGLIKVTSIAGDIKNPKQVIPQAMIASVLSVIILYTSMVMVTTGVLPTEKFDNSLTPITEGARAFLGPWGVFAMSLAAVFAFVTSANAGVMAASRYLYALSRDSLIPKPLSHLSKQARMPVFAILATGVFMGASLFLNLELLVEAASLVLILGYILASVCVIILRESGLQNYRPSFRAPLYPFTQLVCICGFGLLVIELGINAFIICACIVTIGIACYWFYGKRQKQREYALMHLIERLTARELVSGMLERELKEIIHERDDVVLDRFDNLIMRCPVLDIEEEITAQECFIRLGAVIEERVQINANVLAEMIIKREIESSTMLTTFLAIPHIVIPGEGKFEIAIVRARNGITFNDPASKAHAVFLLLGTRDERNFHLRALASIAQISQEPDFEQRWMEARTIAAIRDVVLLGKRIRDSRL